MGMIYAPLLSMFFTVFVALVGAFVIYRTFSDIRLCQNKIFSIENTLEQVKTQSAGTEQAVSLIRTKHYENLSIENAELAHKIRLNADKMESLTERQTRYEAKINARLRRGDEELIPSPERQIEQLLHAGNNGKPKPRRFGEALVKG